MKFIEECEISKTVINKYVKFITDRETDVTDKRN